MLDILYNLYANQLHPLSYSQIMMNVLVLLVLTEVLAKMVKGRLAALVPQPIKEVHVKVSFFLSHGQMFFPSTCFHASCYFAIQFLICWDYSFKIANDYCPSFTSNVLPYAK